jgi:hypothetical protein
MELINTYNQCNDLKQGDTIRRVLKDEHFDYQVYSNNSIGQNVDLLILPLLTPDKVIVDGKIITDGSISGGFPIHRSYQDLMVGDWYKL